MTNNKNKSWITDSLWVKRNTHSKSSHQTSEFRKSVIHRHLLWPSLNDHIHLYASPELFINYHLYGWKPRPILTTALTKRPRGAHKSYLKLRERIWYRIYTNTYALCQHLDTIYILESTQVRVRFARDPGQSWQKRK